MRLRHLILCALCTAMSVSAFAAEPLRLAKIFSDHMVFQQQTTAPVWGWAEPGSKVVVKTSWDSRSYAAKSSESGDWRVEVETPSYGGPYSVKISCGKERIELKDVLVGEVWICSGQSNMEMPVRGFVSANQPTVGAVDTCLDAINYGDRIRIFGVPRNPVNDAPAKDLPSGAWERASYESCAKCSAIAYFFAEYVTNITHIPVGVIYSAWGGTEIRPWMPRECHAKALKGLVSDEEYARRTGYIKPYKNRPRYAGALYNGMIHPFKGFAARGFLWYQGCSNKGDYKFYDKLQAAMVAGWREAWGDTDARMPFYYVLIAPFLRKGSANGFSRGYFVENQAAAAKAIPNCDYASTEGLGGGAIIHPAHKRPVSKQLAMLALDHVYGIEGIESGSPEPKKISFKNGKYVVDFPSGKGLLTPPLEEVKGFEVAGEDKQFYPATARISGNRIIVDIPKEVTSPQSVRYSFRDDPISNIRSSFDFPVAPFRSDDWELVK